MKLTQEQLAELIAKVFANVDEKRKACKEGGEELPENISVEEIMTEITAILSEGGSDDIIPEPENGKGGDGDEPTAVTPEFIAKVIEALGSVKAADEPVTETKAGGPSKAAPQSQPQRKYADLFISTGAARDGVQPSGFKSRIESMSAPERRKTAYGMFGRAVKCIHASGGDVEKAAWTAERKFNDAEMAREFKALSVTSPTDGGYLVPEIYANEIIELLYPSTVIYSLGARRLGMANGNLNIPKLKTGSRALFVGENRSIPKTAPKFGNLKLSAKKLTALIPMSNDLLRSTNFDNDVIVGQDITKQMALALTGAL